MLVFIMLAAGDRRILGVHVSDRPTHILGWLTTAVMAGAAVALLVTAVR
ncbi:MAG: hypothetical protein U0531_14565 [Dehalococcoidia bacterium]